MFNIQELRKNNRTSLFISPFAAQIAAMAVLLIMVLGAPTALAGHRPRPTATPRPDPHAPGNFRVTALGTCTVSVAWDPVNFTLEDFNYYLSGTNQAPPAVLPRTATSHTFTGLGAGNEYWFFIYARDVSGHSSGQSQLVTRTLSDTSPPTTAPGVSVTEVGSNYASIAWTPAEDGGCLLSYEVWVNGSLYVQTGRNVLAYTIRFLQPATTNSRSGATTQGISRGRSPIPFRSRPCHPIPTTTPRRTPRLTCKRSVTATLSSSCGGPNPPMTSIGRRIFATTFT